MQFVFPVIMQHSLGRTGVTGNGIFSSDGTYCSYSIAVKEARPDKVTLALNVTTKPLGKVETVFSKDLEVVRGRITEDQVGEVIGIKAFIEASKDDPR